MKLSSGIGHVLALAFHRDCVCGRPVGSAWLGRWCEHCWAEARLRARLVGIRCRGCALPLKPKQICPDCSKLQPAFDGVLASGLYQGAWKNIIREFKFNDHWSSLRPLRRALLKALPDLKWDHVVAVPSAPSRERQGRPHLAAELATYLSRRKGLPLETDLLFRQPGSRRQSELDSVARRSAAPKMYTGGRRTIKERVLLVDDVMTTGATASACAMLLKQAGACHVDVVVLARSPAH